MRCDGAAILIPLVSQSANAGLALRITADGGYRAEFDVRSADPELGLKLGALGFAPVAGGYRLRVAGVLAS